MSKSSALIFSIVALFIGLGLGYYGGSNGMYPKINPNGHDIHSKMSMDDMMKVMNAKLKDKTGEVFDLAFLDEMIIHHQGAVEMAETALTNAYHQEIKNLAKNIIEAQTIEISLMESWRKSWK